ncbi:MAG: hypothetical protein IPH30_09220 [Betaproteobacteria bacterium]|nr:hypothetical protein [Betaproteobacteria bacterium]
MAGETARTPHQDPAGAPSAGGQRLAAMGAVLAACVAAGFFVDLHPHFEIERIPAFHAILGFVACAALVAVAKLAGALLDRQEGFHDR